MISTKYPISIGVVCFARKTFDFPAAAEIYLTLQKNLQSISNVSWIFIPNLVIEDPDAQQAAIQLAQAQIDGVICISGTFALGHLVLEIHKIVQRPILLWGLEELPYNGGKIRLNSVCGVNLNASNLYKAGVRTYHYVFGQDFPEINNWIDALRIRAALSHVHIGLIGYRAHGFFNLDVDELDLFRETGVLIDHYELAQIFSYKVNEQQIAFWRQKMQSVFDISTLKAHQSEKVAELTAKFHQFMLENHLSAVTVRCWPEFAAEYGISPCASMSLLQSEGNILACEGDLLGCLSMVAHQAIGAETPFLVDFSQVNFTDDYCLLWHCGVAPCNLWDGQCNRSLDTYFAGGKGVTADFVLKSGKISLQRIDYAPGEYRIFLQQGTGLPMEKELKGTYVKVQFSNHIRQILEKIVSNGIAHHISLVYGDFQRPFEIFAHLQQWNIIQ